MAIKRFIKHTLLSIVKLSIAINGSLPFCVTNTHHKITGLFV